MRKIIIYISVIALITGLTGCCESEYQEKAIITFTDGTTKTYNINYWYTERGLLILRTPDGDVCISNYKHMETKSINNTKY